ncbi:hypothetical protein DFS34DRAFT_648176 [Phlyctochytrium arcticum]|nr:hypothetical protein DFS34DRAFT_648176 [Phlyctochytrium arcticum]
MLVVEVDEDQHSSSACECEPTRMVNISQSFGMATVFLGWNPGEYRNPRIDKLQVEAEAEAEDDREAAPEGVLEYLPIIIMNNEEYNFNLLDQGSYLDLLNDNLTGNGDDQAPTDDVNQLEDALF